MPNRIESYSFADPRNIVVGTSTSLQIRYLNSYLVGLSAIWVLEETEYFDRDFLSEYSAFYSTVSHTRTPKTKRFHYFSSEITEEIFQRALKDDEIALKSMQESYLGFTIWRPLESTPLGRTILKWYPDSSPATPRIVTPSRMYSVHIVGICLSIFGIPWQQQDGGVGACATVALWTMLHSSAFEEYHAIPTTAQITKAGNVKNSNGSRMFPSGGMTAHQITDAISKLGLAPISIKGDVETGGDIRLFTKERFCGFISSIVRSGYPVLIAGIFRDNNLGLHHHATCCVGFRDAKPVRPRKGSHNIQDEWIEYIYVNDDNVGPNARFQMFFENHLLNGQNDYVAFRRSSPICALSKDDQYFDFIPYQLFAAVHDEMRLPFDRLFTVAENISNAFLYIDKAIHGQPDIGITMTCKIVKCYDYIGRDLNEVMENRGSALSRVKLELFNAKDIMSLHVGIIRIGDGDIPLIDIIIDTTDSPHNAKSIAHIVYEPSILSIVQYYLADQNYSISLNGQLPNIGDQIIGY